MSAYVSKILIRVGSSLIDTAYKVSTPGSTRIDVSISSFNATLYASRWAGSISSSANRTIGVCAPPAGSGAGSPCAIPDGSRQNTSRPSRRDRRLVIMASSLVSLRTYSLDILALAGACSELLVVELYNQSCERLAAESFANNPPIHECFTGDVGDFCTD